MPDLRMPTAFKNIDEALQIAVHVDVRIGDRITHPRLGREMDHPVETILPEELRHAIAVGNIQLHKAAPDGSVVVIKLIQPGEVFAEVILFESDRYPATAVSLSGSLVLLLPKRDILRLLSMEEFRNDFIAMLLRKQRYLAEQIFNLTTRDIEQRLFLFLRQHYGPQPRMQIDLSKKDLAAAIGTSPESLSRLILRLKKKKIFQWTGKTIVFKAGFWEKRN